MGLKSPADLVNMSSRSCISTAIQAAQVIVAMRGRHFQGYALRSRTEGWLCVFSTGMTWSKSSARTFEEARTLFRTMSHAQQFDVYDSIADLDAVLDKLQPFQRPSILPDDLPPVSNRLPRLQLS